MRPRASRIPGIKDPSVPLESLLYSSRLSKWLDEEALVSRGRETNWRRQYKLRHNWSRGSCDISEIDVAEKPLIPPLLVQLHEGIVISADRTLGLRAWNIKDDKRLLASMQFRQGGQAGSAEKNPTSMAIHARQETGNAVLDVVVGFADGCFGLYRLDQESARFSHCYSHLPATRSPVTAIAISDTFVVALTDLGLLSLYQFYVHSNGQDNGVLKQPRLVSSLRSHTTWPPASLSLRPRVQDVVISIAYALPTHLSGWSVGIQELHVSPDGDIKLSRLASALRQGFVPLSPPSSPPSPDAGFLVESQNRGQPSLSKPTSLSYNHPYLLAAHPDNTLTLYMVKSSSTDLSVSAGSRLWGHTSAVSGAYVGSRGRAVSVSSRGHELRIWELEGGMSSAEARRRLAGGDLSVQVRPEPKGEDDAADQEQEFHAMSALPPSLHMLRARTPDPAAANAWIGFDDERVVILRQQEVGRGALVIYDFT